MEFNIEVKITEGKVSCTPIDLFGGISGDLISVMIDLGMAVNRFEDPSVSDFTGEINVSGFLQNIRGADLPNSTPYGSWSIENIDSVIMAEKDNVVYVLSYLIVSTSN